MAHTESSADATLTAADAQLIRLTLAENVRLLRRFFNRLARNDYVYVELTPLSQQNPMPEEEALAWEGQGHA